MNIPELFEEIIQYSHFWNWSPDWQVAKDIYTSFPNSYSVLTPFAYSYLEELIRTTTSEYGIEILREDGTPKKRKVGVNLINLALEENKDKSQEFLSLLEELKGYFSFSTKFDSDDNRNSVLHGYMHSRFWSDKSFEKLLSDIARMSKFANF
ncbi:hypothetical protein [Cognataquiflexum aquatile]|uniref:hypothetical protein n=1 Tax=Cognataquiflexum aquatile TaxID=2249427 RepID=UPI000DE913FF|nr:hypothetical protein [Cognataquiflexum aquatile]